MFRCYTFIRILNLVLVLEVHTNKLTLSPIACDSRAPPKDEGDTSHMKRRVINGKVIIIDFLINDLSFYLESER